MNKNLKPFLPMLCICFCSICCTGFCFVFTLLFLPDTKLPEFARTSIQVIIEFFRVLQDLRGNQGEEREKGVLVEAIGDGGTTKAAR